MRPFILRADCLWFLFSDSQSRTLEPEYERNTNSDGSIVPEAIQNYCWGSPLVVMLQRLKYRHRTKLNLNYYCCLVCLLVIA